MSFSTTLPAAMLETILARLAILFLDGANGNEAAARQAASQMLAAYNPETAAELRLAANIVSFSLHALEALSQAAHPDIALTKILRLRGSAVSLSRESHKAERRLDQLQQARRAGHPEPVSPEPLTPPRMEKAVALIETTRQTIAAAPPVWSADHQKRQNALRISQNIKQNQLAHAAKLAAATPHPQRDSSFPGTATGSACPAT